ncbi:hypothetical protein LINPERHAP2_LOCUS24867 [Linum perenne]
MGRLLNTPMIFYLFVWTLGWRVGRLITCLSREGLLLPPRSSILYLAMLYRLLFCQFLSVIKLTGKSATLFGAPWMVVDGFIMSIGKLSVSLKALEAWG